MRLFSAYLNRQAARDVDSVFEAEHQVELINKDGKDMFQLVKSEKEDVYDMQAAEETREIPDVIREEKEQVQDINDIVNRSFQIIREGVMVIHTQLDILKRLKREDDILEQSGFPIEVADQLEEMLAEEIKKITRHLREMGSRIEVDDAEKTDDSAS